MNFDAVVVKVGKYLLFFQIGSGHTVLGMYGFTITLRQGLLDLDGRNSERTCQI